MSPVSVNKSAVKDPKWTGVDGEPAIVVSRGEPHRDNTQMQQAVYGQLQRYLTGHTDIKLNDVALALTAQLIAQDHIDPPGMQGVVLSREHLLLYVKGAQAKLAEIGGY